MTIRTWARCAAACAAALALSTVPAAPAGADDGCAGTAATIVRTPQTLVLADGDTGYKRPV
ncbi:hypothetical protein [Nonomuraea wenchangensis]|uniref:Uncharacterized protein n=1 Tax=Nonomuraea wenchangensis TaxID=568860 RepID=A0A1I0HL96_9ACTN|nr:hypothetical protein [Nonomuraea wenchangensis]SET84719.1 hypothetical protein SAMN05421811_104373 [Nonomuraea wenchangensis]